MAQGTLYRLWLVFWKNLILRKRHYIVTALEIVLPTLFAILIAVVRSRVTASGNRTPDQSFPPTPQQEILNRIRSNIFPSYNPSMTPPLMGYEPNTGEVESFVKTRLGPEILKLANDNSTTITWRGFATERELEVFVAEQGLGDSRNLRFAIVMEGLKGISEVYPNGAKISYKIRLLDGYFESTKNLMPWLITASECANRRSTYIDSGFIGLQLLIDKSLTAAMSPGGNAPVVEIATQGFPCPANDGFDINQLYFLILPQFMVLGFVFIIPSIVRGIVSEKETGIKELMRMIGLPNWMHWVGWMLNSLSVLIISITIVIVVFFIPFNSEAGAVLKNSDPSLWWFVMLIYIIWATTYCFLISSIFERPTLATTLGIVLWIICYYGVGASLDSQYQDFSMAAKLFLCLVPNVGFQYALKVLSAFEAKKGIGAQWSNIATSVSTVDPLTLLHVIGMLVLASIINTLLAMYFESVIPTKYGVREPWYFIFLPSTWGIGKSNKVKATVQSLRSERSSAKNEGFEKDPQNLKAGLEILKLGKQFGKKTAVDDVSVKAYLGQIFCLLGHNGAGKTTTMSMLTGMLAPSSGTALVNGRDIRNEMSDIRENLGLCPQHNLLFDKLTVSEHLTLFGMVKGLNRAEARTQVPLLISKLRLTEKTNALAMSLSGGQKRRLSLGMAIIGNSEVLFLDECSSGLDPEARRVIWDLLLEVRHNKTIILTTHFLEEADVLGDRIAIMAAGKIRCCGSPMFLKKYYGTGHTLSLGLTSMSSVTPVVDLIQHHIPSAVIMSQEQKDNALELNVCIPTDGNPTARFPNMFGELREEKSSLGILDIGISLTTLDEVFLKVDELAQSTDNVGSFLINSSVDVSSGPKATGVQLLLDQYWGLLVKKVLYSRRRWKLTASQLVIPLLALIGSVLIINQNYKRSENYPPLKMDLKAYKNQHIVYSVTNDAEKIGAAYTRLITSHASTKLQGGANLTSELLSISHQEQDTYFQRYIVAAAIRSPDMVAMHSGIAMHSSPLSVNLITNSILNSLNQGKDFVLEVTNHPLSSRIEDTLDAASLNPSFSTVAPYVFGILVSIALALLGASYIVLPIEERKCQGKQLQLMTGVNPVIYWGSSFVWDYFVTLILAALMVACLYIFEIHQGFTNNSGGGVCFLIIVVYAVGAILFSYLLSLLAGTPAGGFALATGIHLLTGIGASIAVYVLFDVGAPKEWRAARIIGWLARLFPTFGISRSLMIYTRTSTRNSRCNVLTADITSVICNPNLDSTRIREYQACCDNCLELGARCFKPTPYLQWDYQEEVLGINYGATIPGIGQELLWMTIMSIVYACILISVEYGLVKKLLNLFWKQGDFVFVREADDSDVMSEVERVKSVLRTGKTKDDALIVDSLCKSYGSFSAVSKLSFGVQHGECFGLLGVNGAGKTTTFKMLTGEEIISGGNGWMGNTDLIGNRKEFLSRLGYCPQFDGIIGVLTGQEMLEIFGRLRGIKSSQLHTASTGWLDRFGLLESATVQCQNYSGGMKRRLSAAMALIGDPPLILLDEPTSGVDPASRRQFWNIISSLKESGRSIVLTSHSMEECEHLCGRLGIMVNGEMQCVGRVQHLKSKFARGYTLTLRLKPVDQTTIGAALNDMIHQITNQLYPCSLKDHHQNNLQFHIENASMHLDEVFGKMEAIRSRFDFMEEYSVQQTTLEEVFLEFARRQYPERTANLGFFRKTMSCVFGC